MKKIILFLILVTFVFSSCLKYKSGSYSVEGMVISDSTHAPAQDVVVCLYCSSLIEKGHSYYGVDEVSETTTDSQGKYKIYYKKLRSSKYRYSVDIKRTGIYSPLSFPQLSPPGSHIGNNNKNSTIDLSIH